MKITVNDCLKLDAFDGCQVLACHSDLERRVRSVSVLDETDLSMGVERNGIKEQMVITHFWSSSSDVDAQARAVKGLGDREVSALVIYLSDKGLKTVDGKVIEAAEKAALPLITIRDEGNVTYSMLIEQVMDKILYGDNYSDNILNNTIYQQITEDIGKTATRTNGKHTHFFLFRFHLRLQLTVLFKHVFNLRTIQLTKLQSIGKRLTRLIRVHMYFHKL
jgi:hypothetical protein